MGTLALTQEVLLEEKHAWMVGWLHNSANRCRVLETIRQHSLTCPAIETYLLELGKALAPLPWQMRKLLIQTLNASLGHRAGRLREIWSELGLPQGLPNL